MNILGIPLATAIINICQEKTKNKIKEVWHQGGESPQKVKAELCMGGKATSRM